MNDQPLFPVVDAIPVSEVSQPSCEFPFVIVAYWPTGGWWKVNEKMWSGPDVPALKREIERLQENGWTYIKIMRLPI